MTSFSKDMAKFIHELRSRPLHLVDDGIGVDPTSMPRRPAPKAPSPNAQQHAPRHAQMGATPHLRKFAAKSRPQPPVTAGSSGGRWQPRPQIISYFIDYFVVFVTVAGVYFGYRMVSHTADLSPDYLTRYGLISLVCLSVLFLVYKTLHRALAVPSLGELWRSRIENQRMRGAERKR